MNLRKFLIATLSREMQYTLRSRFCAGVGTASELKRHPQSGGLTSWSKRFNIRLRRPSAKQNGPRTVFQFAL